MCYRSGHNSDLIECVEAPRLGPPGPTGALEVEKAADIAL